ncbi:MAG: winged helix-turn-helix domain-containing protein, partial [Acidobacteriota bacterium]|nr:winged helix-turn-helix domain-containing protein [Acidobacteriota bacterium]
MSKKENAASSLNIYLLGPFRIEVDGVPVAAHHWPRRKAQLLVKILALQPGHQLHREQLMEMLWPDVEPETASQNLHRMIYIARRTLEPRLSSGQHGERARSSFIVARGQQVTLRAPGKLWVDALEFERNATAALKGADVESYLEALALYRGDLLIEDLYEDWAAVARERLRSTHRNLLLGLAHL